MKPTKRLILFLLLALILSALAFGAQAEAAADPNHVHEFTVFVTHHARTHPCTDEEYDVYACKICGKETHINVQPAIGHLPGVDGARIKEPTCTEQGAVEQTCPRCGDKLDPKHLAALGHDFNTTPTTTESTCTVQGYKEYRCKRFDQCGQTHKEMLPLKPHTWGAWNPRIDCTKGGSQSRTCSVCSTVENRTIPAGKHTWGKMEVISPATCIVTGKGRQVCTVCGATQDVTIPKGPHTAPNPEKWLRDDKDPSRDYMLCTVCNRIMKTRAHRGYDDKPAPTQAPNPPAQPQQPIEQPPAQMPVGDGLKALNFGPYVRDLNPQALGTFIDRLTPLDVSVDGVQTYPLITTNGYFIGTINISVSYGMIMVSYTMNDPGTVVSKQILFLHDSLAAVTSSALMNEAATLQFNQPIDLAGRTSVVLDVRLDVAFNAGNPVNRLFSDLGLYTDGVTRNYDLLMQMTNTLMGM